MAHGDVLSEQRARQEAGGCLPHLALAQPTREGISQWGIWVAEKFAKMSAFSDTDICLFLFGLGNEPLFLQWGFK